ncbi:sigma factor-like helix-turn-helix DNA-binding protein [Lentzea sp. BCCO 10_0856]|uniref:Sigma factor-like helix-turn-helix DNA-binding protein n=1 Tax=Lentzea miocenica TaxID=3095431 RepID=A0ABU4T6H3_9PSEU|nr:sigma factor-like helix-turn-helix DNA-binding protein [Lentzea sp. BCCO 10_0856]MDX8033684.1 sigma factor-like helix-turn-helix DNA-binding protein [Lentzea sp. BCCO 10_0856]
MGSSDSALAADRLRIDGVLVQHFRESGLTGPRWDQFHRQLLGHGLTIVTKLVRSGAMFSRCGRHGRYLHQQEISPQEAEELASDAVFDGFVYFRDRGLLGRQWSVEHGQPLTEYFVNACVLAFPNVYRRWQRRVSGWQDVRLVDSFASLDNIVTEGTPEDAVIEQAAANAAFAALSEDNRRLLFLHDQGYSHAEIAELLRLTPRAVEGRIRRARQAVRRHPDEER